MAYDILSNKEIIDAEDMDIPFLNGADVLNADVVNQDVAGTGNDNAINGDQINNGVDNDVVSDPNVTFYGGNGGSDYYYYGYGGGGSDFSESATSTAGAATSSANQAYVGDDGTISNAGNATAAAQSSAGEFSQRIRTDANTQVNTARLDISGDDSTATGGGNNTPASYHDAIAVNNEILDAYELQVSDLNGLQLLNADLVNQNASGPGNDTAINLDQINNLVSNDSVEQADVSFHGGNGGDGYYAEGSDHTIYASATGGNATATGNIARVLAGDGSVSSAGNASSTADATGHAFTQTIETGGNVQANSVTGMIDGGTSGGEEGPAGFARDHVAINGDDYLSDSMIAATYLHVDALDGMQVLNADVVNQNATGSGNDNAINVDQMNNLVDNDDVIDPNVSYSGGNGSNYTGGSGGDFSLTVTATAAVALATSNTATVADDGSISGAGSANSSASATAEAFTQSVETGSNTQANQLKLAVEGGTVVPAEDDGSCGDGDCGPGGHGGPGGGGGPGPNNVAPTSHDDGQGGCQEGCGEDPHGPPGGPGGPGGHHDDPTCYPDVCADDRIGDFHDPAISIDATIIDASSLSVDCLQGLQFLNADVVNQDVSGSGNDNAFHVDQINNLVDNDYVSCPDVSFCGGNGGDGYGYYYPGGDAGTFTLTATATSAAATSSGNFASVGDDGSVSGAGNATSSASAVADAFSQTIVMGANVQFNSMDLNVHGGTDSL